jgi:hypothetical protein
MAKARPWSPHECKLAAELYAAMAPTTSRTRIYRVIAHRLGRSAAAVQSRRRACGISFGHGHGGADATLDAVDIEDIAPTAGRIRISARQLAERDARAEAANRRTYTQEFFGDPPPGFSAKDRRL